MKIIKISCGIFVFICFSQNYGFSNENESNTQSQWINKQKALLTSHLDSFYLVDTFSLDPTKFPVPVSLGHFQETKLFHILMSPKIYIFDSREREFKYFTILNSSPLLLNLKTNELTLENQVVGTYFVYENDPNNPKPTDFSTVTHGFRLNKQVQFTVNYEVMTIDFKTKTPALEQINFDSSELAPQPGFFDKTIDSVLNIIL